MKCRSRSLRGKESCHVSSLSARRTRPVSPPDAAGSALEAACAVRVDGAPAFAATPKAAGTGVPAEGTAAAVCAAAVNAAKATSTQTARATAFAASNTSPAEAACAAETARTEAASPAAETARTEAASPAAESAGCAVLPAAALGKAPARLRRRRSSGAADPAAFAVRGHGGALLRRHDIGDFSLFAIVHSERRSNGFCSEASLGERIATSLRSDRQAESPHP